MERTKLLISELSNELPTEKMLYKALFSIILILENKNNYKSNNKIHPITELRELVHYILLKNKITSLEIDKDTYKLFSSLEAPKSLIKKEISKKGLFYISSEHPLFPVYQHEEIKRKEYPFDVALSFAGENRDIAEKLANKLSKEYYLNVFYDNDRKYELWGKDLYKFLYQTYSKRSLICIILHSKEYQRKNWTQHELKAIQSRLLKEKKDYLLLLKLDETELPPDLSTLSYLAFSESNIEEICQTITDRAWSDKIEYWYSKDDVQDYINKSHTMQIFLNEFYPEFEKENNKEDLLSKLIVCLIFLYEEDVIKEIKGFFEYLIFGFFPISEKFEDEQFTMIHPDCRLLRLINGKSLFAIQEAYWEPIFSRYKERDAEEE